MPSKREGWAGCLTLPREITADAQGRLRQTPVRELLSLRGKEHPVMPCVLENERQILQDCAEAAELELNWDCRESRAERYGLRLGTGCELFVDDQARRLVLARRYPDEQLSGDRSVPLPENGDLRLRIFIDRSSIEVFVNEGEYCLSSRIYPQQDRQLQLFADCGRALCRGGSLWLLKPCGLQGNAL